MDDSHPNPLQPDTEYTKVLAIIAGLMLLMALSFSSLILTGADEPIFLLMFCAAVLWTLTAGVAVLYRLRRLRGWRFATSIANVMLIFQFPLGMGAVGYWLFVTRKREMGSG